MSIQPKATLKGYFNDGDKPTESNFADLVDSLCDDTAYGSGWNGSADIAPSQNAVYDKIETLLPVSSKATEQNILDHTNDDKYTTALGLKKHTVVTKLHLYSNFA